MLEGMSSGWERAGQPAVGLVLCKDSWIPWWSLLGQLNPPLCFAFNGSEAWLGPLASAWQDRGSSAGAGCCAP